MPAPSLDDLIDHVPIRWPFIGPWLEEHRSSEPLTAEALLDLPYAESDLEGEEHEALHEWLEAAAVWGITRWIESEAIDAEGWCRRAVLSSWEVWSSLAPHASEVVSVATNANASREALEAAEAAYRRFERHGPPPPYVGHFHAALVSLLRYRLMRATDLVPECLARACCGPDGTRRTAAIAACRLDPWSGGR